MYVSKNTFIYTYMYIRRHSFALMVCQACGTLGSGKNLRRILWTLLRIVLTYVVKVVTAFDF